MTVKKPSYVGEGGTSASPMPSYVSAANGADDGRPKPRVKSMSEQVGEKSAREKVLDVEIKAIETPDEVHPSVDEREIQPPGFQPFQFVKQRIEEFLERPEIKNGYRLYNRVVFETVDIPVVDISEAFRLKFIPEVLLGIEKERSTTRLFLKFAAPGPDTVMEALEKAFEALYEWDLGEKSYGKEGGHHPKLYVYGTFDYPEEVIIVIA